MQRDDCVCFSDTGFTKDEGCKEIVGRIMDLQDAGVFELEVYNATILTLTWAAKRWTMLPTR